MSHCAMGRQQCSWWQGTFMANFEEEKNLNPLMRVPHVKRINTSYAMKREMWSHKLSWLSGLAHQSWVLVAESLECGLESWHHTLKVRHFELNMLLITQSWLGTCTGTRLLVWAPSFCQCCLQLRNWDGFRNALGLMEMETNSVKHFEWPAWLIHNKYVILLSF